MVMSGPAETCGRIWGSVGDIIVFDCQIESESSWRALLRVEMETRDVYNYSYVATLNSGISAKYDCPN